MSFNAGRQATYHPIPSALTPTMNVDGSCRKALEEAHKEGALPITQSSLSLFFDPHPFSPSADLHNPSFTPCLTHIGPFPPSPGYTCL